jgi:hypothetical protein
VKAELIGELRERLLAVAYALNKLGPFDLTEASRRQFAQEAQEARAHEANDNDSREVG